MTFTLKDFDSLPSKDKNKIKIVENKLKNLVKQIDLKVDYFSGTYRYKNRLTGFLTKSKNKPTDF